MNTLVLLVAAAFMVVAGIYWGQQGLALAKVNRSLRTVVKEMQTSLPLYNNVTAFLDSREFYELSQSYRHAPLQNPAAVVAAWEELKAAILASASQANPRSESKT
jgi:hypothetical protein